MTIDRKAEDHAAAGRPNYCDSVPPSPGRIQLDSVELAVLTSGVEAAASRRRGIPADCFRMVEPVDQDARAPKDVRR